MIDGGDVGLANLEEFAPDRDPEDVEERLGLLEVWSFFNSAFTESFPGSRRSATLRSLWS